MHIAVIGAGMRSKRRTLVNFTCRRLVKQAQRQKLKALHWWKRNGKLKGEIAKCTSHPASCSSPKQLRSERCKDYLRTVGKKGVRLSEVSKEGPGARGWKSPQRMSLAFFSRELLVLCMALSCDCRIFTVLTLTHQIPKSL